MAPGVEGLTWEAGCVSRGQGPGQQQGPHRARQDWGPEAQASVHTQPQAGHHPNSQSFKELPPKQAGCHPEKLARGAGAGA